MDDRYMGFASREELVPALNELLEAGRAGRIMLATAREMSGGSQKAFILAIHRDEAC